MSYDLAYVMTMINRGFSLEFIAKDSGIQLESLKRRVNRSNAKADK
jgi:hypothetical protein